MSVGEVVFNVSDGYDEDMWDDSLLIRNYEKALESSRRELMRRRKEGGKKRKHWNLGEPCRVLHSFDGLEYEGTIVNLSARNATVRLHGYNEELEVSVQDLEQSLGQHEIQNQIEQANLEGFEEEEEPFSGKLSAGSFCRARWSLDDIVYEGIIESVDTVKHQIRVKFLGYLNEDTVDMENVYNSKGEDWRAQQIEDSKCEVMNGDLSDTLNSFMDQNSEVLSQIPGLASLTLGESSEKTKSKGKSRHKKEKSTPKVDKHSKKEKKKGDPNSCLGSKDDPSELPSLPNLNMNFELPDPSSLPSPLYGTSGIPRIDDMPRIGPPPPLPCMPPYFSMSDGFSHQQNEVLQTMLHSWYMAGYHTGYFQAISNQNLHKKRPRETSDKSKL